MQSSRHSANCCTNSGENPTGNIRSASTECARFSRAASLIDLERTARSTSEIVEVSSAVRCSARILLSSFFVRASQPSEPVTASYAAETRARSSPWPMAGCAPASGVEESHLPRRKPGSGRICAAKAPAGENSLRLHARCRPRLTQHGVLRRHGSRRCRLWAAARTPFFTADCGRFGGLPFRPARLPGWCRQKVFCR